MTNAQRLRIIATTLEEIDSMDSVIEVVNELRDELMYCHSINRNANIMDRGTYHMIDVGCKRVEIIEPRNYQCGRGTNNELCRDCERRDAERPE